VLNQLVFETAGKLALDLEAFANHAKRKVVNVEDVLLYARNNQYLVSAVFPPGGEVLAYDESTDTTECCRGYRDYLCAPITALCDLCP